MEKLSVQANEWILLPKYLHDFCYLDHNKSTPTKLNTDCVATKQKYIWVMIKKDNFKKGLTKKVLI